MGKVEHPQLGQVPVSTIYRSRRPRL